MIAMLGIAMFPIQDYEDGRMNGISGVVDWSAISGDISQWQTCLGVLADQPRHDYIRLMGCHKGDYAPLLHQSTDKATGGITGFKNYKGGRMSMLSRPCRCYCLRRGGRGTGERDLAGEQEPGRGAEGRGTGERDLA